MIDPLSDEDRKAVLDILSELKENPPHNFTPQQIEALREITDFWLGMVTAGKIARSLARILQWTGWMVALYLWWKSGIWSGFIKTLIGSPQ